MNNSDGGMPISSKNCPNCGAPINIGDKKCSNCGYQFMNQHNMSNNIKSTEPIHNYSDSDNQDHDENIYLNGSSKISKNAKKWLLFYVGTLMLLVLFIIAGIISSTYDDSSQTVSTTSSSTKHKVKKTLALEKIKYGTPTVPWEGDDGHPAVEPLRAGHILYYQMKLPEGSLYYNVWMQAIKAWNGLGVITLTPKPKNYPYHDYIKLDGDDNPADKNLTQKQLDEGDYEVGITNFNYDDSYPGYAKMTDVKSKLTANGLYSSHREQLIDAEHELGHALGFAHDPKNYGGSGNPKYVVMNPNVPLKDEFQPLGQIERDSLIAVYGLAKK